jgi:hypothetical protein
MISGGGVVVCVGSVLVQELDELCCVNFTLPYPVNPIWSTGYYC